MLALAPHDLTPRVVHLAPSEYRAIVAELEADPDFPAPVAGRCALCHGPLTAAEADGTGVAHRECSENAMREIEAQDFDEWVNSCESRYAYIDQPN